MTTIHVSNPGHGCGWGYVTPDPDRARLLAARVQSRLSTAPVHTVEEYRARPVVTVTMGRRRARRLMLVRP